MLCLLVSQRDQEDRAQCLVMENQVMNLILSGTGQEMLQEKMYQDRHYKVHLMAQLAQVHQVLYQEKVV